ncbi:hypothetical protein MTR_7g083890 [Medicago truncatula]|uniref:Uncharacterized protein n=1 Tax=Medicago truncatula TaxID=3880 RepID=G7KX82_MEDTR|nr:hypothetical protein MTR_7g083890 [Medicago truncatula]
MTDKAVKIRLRSTPANGRLIFFFFFCGGQGSNPEPCIYYVMSLSTELSSREQRHLSEEKLILSQDR